MKTEIKIPLKRLILGIYRWINVLTDIHVYQLPDDLESCNFQDEFHLCPNKQGKSKNLKFPFYTTSIPIFKNV